MKLNAKLTRNLLALAILLVGYLPAVRVPTMGDDLYLQFEAHGLFRGDFVSWTIRNLEHSVQAGHFKPLGNFVDSTIQYLVFPVSHFFGMSTRVFYFVEGFMFIALTIFIGSRFLHLLSKVFLNDKTSENSSFFLILSTVTAATIQIHPWSNDPVTTYIATGWGSTALLFLALLFTLKFIELKSKKYMYLACITHIVGVLYYEMALAGVVAAFALILASKLLAPRKIGLNDNIKFLHVSFIAGIPLLVFLLGRVISGIISPDSGGYTGTQFSISFSGLFTLFYALVSAIPAGAWNLSAQHSGILQVHWPALIVLFPYVFLLFFGATWKTPKNQSGRSYRLLILPIMLLALISGLAASAHAFTPKYQIEISEPGRVYLYYATASVCVSMMIVLALFYLFDHARSNIVTIGVAQLAVVSFAVVQFIINWGVGSTSQLQSSTNVELVQVFSSQTIEAKDACDSLRKWYAGGWPEYYKEGIAQNAQVTFEIFRGEKLCSSGFQAE